MSYIAAAVLMGACVALQPPINAAMARTLGSPFLAASISIGTSLVLVLVLVGLTSRSGGDLTQVRALPWWVVLGGVIGVVFVAGSAIVAPVLGVASFFVCIVGGQLVASTVVDYFGAFGIAPKPIDTMKLLGLGLVLIGAALAQNARVQP